jgi:hypothetical protein
VARFNRAGLSGLLNSGTRGAALKLKSQGDKRLFSPKENQHYYVNASEGCRSYCSVRGSFTANVYAESGKRELQLQSRSLRCTVSRAFF